jgi:hypothetical protein
VPIGLSLGLDLTGIPAAQGASVGPSNTVDPAFSGLTPSAFEVAGDGIEEVDLAVHAANENDQDLASKATTIAQEIVRPTVAQCYVLAAGTVEADTETTITVGILDADGVPIPDVDAAGITIASTGTGNTLGQATGRTNEIGEVYGTFESSVEESKTISATIDDVNGDPVAITDTATIVVGDPPAPPAPGDPFFEDDFAGPDYNSDETFVWGVGQNVDPVSFGGFDALRFRFTPAAYAQQNAIISENKTEVWFQYDLYVDTDFDYQNTSPNNNKFIRLWGDDYGERNKVGASLFYNGSYEENTTLRYEYVQHGETGVETNGSPSVQFVPTAGLGTWRQFRLHFKIVSSDGAADGVFQLWIDGTLVYDLDAVNQRYVTGVNYWNALYLFGSDNAEYLVTTDFYLKAFKAYDTDPGW